MPDHTQLIRNVLAEHGRLATDVSTLTNTSSLYEAGLTSHASVNVMLALEDEFDVEFPEKFLKRSTFETIENLRLALDDLVGIDV